MIGFSDELSSSIGINVKDIYSNFQVSIIGANACYVQNYVKINSYNKEKVVLKVKGNELAIEGVNLTIQELEKNNILLVGKINKTYLVKEFKGADNEKENQK